MLLMTWEYLILYKKVILYIECDFRADTHTHAQMCTHPYTKHWKETGWNINNTCHSSQGDYCDFNFLLYKQLSNNEFKIK